MKVRVIAAVMAAFLAVVGAVLVSGYVRTADARALDGTETQEVFDERLLVRLVHDRGAQITMRAQALSLELLSQRVTLPCDGVEARYEILLTAPRPDIGS